MKTNFKFYFRLITNTSYVSAILYGFRQHVVEDHITLFSFILLGIVVAGMVGMMRNMVPPPVEVLSSNQ